MKLSQLEAAFVKQAYKIRETLAKAKGGDPICSHFMFMMKIEGRVLDGDLKMSVNMGEYGESVKGNAVDITLREFLRRLGYEEKHNTLCLPSVMPKALDEERIELDLSSDQAAEDAVAEELRQREDNLPF